MQQGDSPKQKESIYVEIVGTLSLYRERRDESSMREPFLELSAETLHGHFIVFPQDPEPPLHLLPSPELTLHSLIKLFLLGTPHGNSDSNSFLLVRKANVLAALQYLVQQNHLYSSLTINCTMIDD